MATFFVAETLRPTLGTFPAESFNIDQPILVRGVSTMGDIQPEVWCYIPNSMATPDGTTVIKPYDLTDLQAGRFHLQFKINTGAVTRTFNNAPARSLVSVAASANGFQVSTTNDSMVNYSVTISTTVSLAGNSTGYVVLEICPTNSATANQWVEIGRATSGQSGTLVVGLVLNQSGGGQVGGMVPAGWFARIRTVNTSGTPTYTINGQQEVLL